MLPGFSLLFDGSTLHLLYIMAEGAGFKTGAVGAGDA
jgi:hypothetical protein